MREPEFSGSGGRSWKIESEPHRVKWPTSLDAWLVHCPGAHIAWSWYFISGCSLADEPGLPPAKKHYPEAEWEVIIWALNPDHDHELISYLEGPADAVLRWHHLKPANLVHQFHGPLRDGANAIMEAMARMIVHGQISPDSDYMRMWKLALKDTVEHFTEGHGVGDA